MQTNTLKLMIIITDGTINGCLANKIMTNFYSYGSKVINSIGLVKAGILYLLFLHVWEDKKLQGLCVCGGGTFT